MATIVASSSPAADLCFFLAGNFVAWRRSAANRNVLVGAESKGLVCNGAHAAVLQIITHNTTSAPKTPMGRVRAVESRK